MSKYLLDSNIYLNFYERYYQRQIFPSFWTSIIPIINQHVIVPKIVIAENYQDPWFSSWIDKEYKQSTLNHKHYSSEWGEILNHIQSNECYKEAALTSDRGWAHDHIADAWIIAIAKKDQLTLVTEEKRNPNLSIARPSKAAKIPDICDDLGIRCITMNQFFDEIKLVI